MDWGFETVCEDLRGAASDRGDQPLGIHHIVGTTRWLLMRRSYAGVQAVR
jgi:hypothetical protein